MKSLNALPAKQDLLKTNLSRVPVIATVTTIVIRDVRLEHARMLSLWINNGNRSLKSRAKT